MFVSNQVTEEDAVYDVVDEKEYAERVKGRVEEAQRAVERDWRSAFGGDQ